MDDDAGGVSPFPDTALGVLYAFLAKHASMGAIRIRGALLDQTLRFLVLGPVTLGGDGTSSAQGTSWGDRQKQLVKLLQRLCASALWDTNDPEDILPLVERCGMYSAAVVLHKYMNNFEGVVDAYLADTDRVFQVQVFQFIRTEYVMMKHAGSADRIIFAAIARLLQLDTLQTVQLVVHIFPQLNTRVIDTLEQVSQQALFDYLHVLWHAIGLMQTDASLSVEDADWGPLVELTRNAEERLNMTTELQLQYIQLLCQYQPEDVCAYLKSGVGFPVKEALAICEDYEIQDALAFLLERDGNIEGALALILKTVDTRLRQLIEAYENSKQSFKRGARGPHRHEVIDGSASSITRFRMRSMSGNGGDPNATSPTSPYREEQAVAQILDAALSLCRNSCENVFKKVDKRAKREQLWFKVLDAFDVEKRNDVKFRSKSSPLEQDILHKLGESKRVILDSMTPFVSMDAMLIKMTEEHSGDQFLQFKKTIFGFVDQLTYEESIYTTANKLLQHDLMQNIVQLQASRAKGLPANPKEVCLYQTGMISLADPAEARDHLDDVNSPVVLYPSGVLAVFDAGVAQDELPTAQDLLRIVRQAKTAKTVREAPPTTTTGGAAARGGNVPAHEAALPLMPSDYRQRASEWRRHQKKTKQKPSSSILESLQVKETGPIDRVDIFGGFDGAPRQYSKVQSSARGGKAHRVSLTFDESFDKEIGAGVHVSLCYTVHTGAWTPFLLCNY
jgi:hypothetical protein